MNRRQAAAKPPVFVSQPKQEKPRELQLPKASRCAARAVNYLAGRGIDRELIDFYIRPGGSIRANRITMSCLSGRIKAARRGTPIFAVSGRISSGMPMAAISIILCRSRLLIQRDSPPL